MEVCHDEGRTSGYAFNNSDGSRPSPTEYNAIARQYFQAIQEEEDDLVDPNIDVIQFGISRTYRKSASQVSHAVLQLRNLLSPCTIWYKLNQSPHSAAML